MSDEERAKVLQLRDRFIEAGKQLMDTLPPDQFAAIVPQWNLFMEAFEANREYAMSSVARAAWAVVWQHVLLNTPLDFNVENFNFYRSASRAGMN